MDSRVKLSHTEALEKLKQDLSQQFLLVDKPIDSFFRQLIKPLETVNEQLDDNSVAFLMSQHDYIASIFQRAHDAIPFLQSLVGKSKMEQDLAVMEQFKVNHLTPDETEEYQLENMKVYYPLTILYQCTELKRLRDGFLEWHELPAVIDTSAEVFPKGHVFFQQGLTLNDLTVIKAYLSDVLTKLVNQRSDSSIIDLKCKDDTPSLPFLKPLCESDTVKPKLNHYPGWRWLNSQNSAVGSLLAKLNKVNVVEIATLDDLHAAFDVGLITITKESVKDEVKRHSMLRMAAAHHSHGENTIYDVNPCIIVPIKIAIVNQAMLLEDLMDKINSADIESLDVAAMSVQVTQATQILADNKTLNHLIYMLYLSSVCTYQKIASYMQSAADNMKLTAVVDLIPGLFVNSQEGLQELSNNYRNAIESPDFNHYCSQLAVSCREAEDDAEKLSDFLNPDRRIGDNVKPSFKSNYMSLFANVLPGTQKNVDADVSEDDDDDCDNDYAVLRLAH